MNEDFGFYGSDAEERTETVIKGITDRVTGFSYSSISYPCLVLKEDFKCPKHQIKVISNMVKNTCGVKDVSLYFLKNNELFKMGSISGLQVGFLLDMVGVGQVFGYFSSSTKLEGDALYTLCTVA